MSNQENVKIIEKEIRRVLIECGDRLDAEPSEAMAALIRTFVQFGLAVDDDVNRLRSAMNEIFEIAASGRTTQ